MPDIDLWYLENLVCPVERARLHWDGACLVSDAGRRYPVIEGIPIMLVEERDQTIGVAAATMRCARETLAAGIARDEFYVATLGISEVQRAEVARLVAAGNSRIEPVVSYLVAATNGIAYKSLVGHLTEYPIPKLRLPAANPGELLLDIGCNWGRWCMAAAKLGYAAVGIDPSLGSVLAARRVSRSMGLDIRFVVGDARFLPFREGLFDRVFSYSVLQHFSKPDCIEALKEVGRTLKPDGSSFIQMAHAIGVRSFQHQARRRFREARDFEVRYWTIPEMSVAFEREIGPAKISVDCYFGLGLQKSDGHLMKPFPRLAMRLSEALRFMSRFFTPLVYAADSIYVSSRRIENAFSKT